MSATPIDRNDRRRSVRMTYANALLWSVGNGLASTTLIIWLAIELGAEGIAISWIIAAPKLAGVLRLAAPQVIRSAENAARWFAGEVGGGWGRKGVCLAAYALSGVMLVLVPFAAVAARNADDPESISWLGGPIGVLVIAWSGYHLLEYTANVALWSWIGDVYPLRARARLIGWRERWLVVGRVVGIALSVGLAALWAIVIPDSAARWIPLAASASVGAAMIVAAVFPLAQMPAISSAPSAWPRSPWQTAVEAFRRRPFRRLLAYSCWLGFANGVTASALSMYASRVLGFGYATMRSMQAGMFLSQAAIAPRSGVWIERFGIRRVLIPAQLIVALGPLCYFFADSEVPAWGLVLLVLAHVAWVAYAPINVGLDTLKLGLADQQNNAPYLAVYHALSNVVHGAMVIAGGALYDVLAAGDSRALQVYAGLFLAGWVLRSLAAGWILRLDEPGLSALSRP